MTAPFDPPADPIGERASELLDAGRTPSDAGIDPVVAQRLTELIEARRALRDVPAPDPVQRERAITAALAAFDARSTDDERTGGGGAPVVSLDSPRSRAVAARRPRWLNPAAGIAAALVLIVGIASLARLGRTSEQKTSANVSTAAKAAGASATSRFAGRAAASTAAAAAAGGNDLSADQDSSAKAESAPPAPAAASAATAGAQAGGAASTAAPKAAALPSTTGASAPATTVATAAPATTPQAGSLPDLGAIADQATLRTRLDNIAGQPGTATSVPATNDACTASDRRPIARLTWQGTPAVVYLTNDGHYLVLAGDCRELTRF